MLVKLCKTATKHDIGIYFDAVLSHKMAGDAVEQCTAVEVNGENRLEEVSEAKTIEAWFRFDFEGRMGKYSDMKYTSQHFSGTDWDQTTEKKAIYRITGKDRQGWAKDVDDYYGNYDYLMCSNVDYSNREVQEDVISWGKWIVKELNLSGIRLDAARHVSHGFLNKFVTAVNQSCPDKDLFWIGECRHADVGKHIKWIENSAFNVRIHDEALFNNFATLSLQHEEADLRTILDNTLVESRPDNAVTFVHSHDSQDISPYTKVEEWILSLAYCLILLRKDGHPTVFLGDLHGVNGVGENKRPSSCDKRLVDMMMARKLCAYGAQEDYWAEKNVIGFVRRGTWDRPFGLACVMCNDVTRRDVRMNVGGMHRGEIWTDLLGWCDDEIVIDNDGFGTFPCQSKNVSIWVRDSATDRDEFPVDYDYDVFSFR